ncbi:MAG: glycosyltransferase [Acidobacteria bacterium]|nr:glycosyltransferase [Acidobacteriota bacterium]
MKKAQRLQRLQEGARQEVTAGDLERALALCARSRVALFIVAYNAEQHLESVIQRVPGQLLPAFDEIFIIDDSSSDSTFQVGLRLVEAFPQARIRVFRTPFNRGYGGNQKLGYRYAIRRGFDFVVLLHGDGQYAPEYLPKILAACADGADAVLASRMAGRRQALRGGMPFHKWIGNRILTALGNRILGTSFSEFHTGYRAYRVGALARVPFAANTDDFHFDGEILAQAAFASWNIAEVPIPTYYGDEVCHVPGLRYGARFLTSLVLARLTRIGIFFQKNFDVALYDQETYTFKRSPHSLHQWVLENVELGRGLHTIELGANRGRLSAEIASRTGNHVAVDRFQPDLAGSAEAIALDLDEPFAGRLGAQPYDICLALDVVEHLASPERFVEGIFAIVKPGGTVILSTANVAYILVRISLLLGQFNYGKRGILDMTHTRLFTISSFERLLQQGGFRIEKVRGFPPPFTDMVGRSRFFRAIEAVHALLSRWFPRLFAFNFAIVATRLDDVDDILRRTITPASG